MNFTMELLYNQCHQWCHISYSFRTSSIVEYLRRERIILQIELKLRCPDVEMFASLHYVSRQAFPDARLQRGGGVCKQSVMITYSWNVKRSCSEASLTCLSKVLWNVMKCGTECFQLSSQSGFDRTLSSKF